MILLLALVACKAKVPASSSSGYSEDLSVHRPQLTDLQTESPAELKVKEGYTPLSNHLKEELDSIAKISYERNKAGRRVDGYVIQVYSGTTRDEANEALTMVIEQFPELESKISYRQPNFRVRGGKFTDRLEANRIYNEVKASFPNALLIPERLVISYE